MMDDAIDKTGNSRMLTNIKRTMSAPCGIVQQKDSHEVNQVKKVKLQHFLIAIYVFGADWIKLTVSIYFSLKRVNFCKSDIISICIVSFHETLTIDDLRY